MGGVHYELLSLSGTLVGTRSRVFPAECVGSSVNWERLRSNIASQNFEEKGCSPDKELQLMSLQLKSPNKIMLLEML